MTRQRWQGFTLIELLVVISIMSLLMAILLPVLSQAKKTAQGSKCMSNLKQISAANAAYMNFNNDAYPRPWSPGGNYYGHPSGDHSVDNITFMFHFNVAYPWVFGTPRDDGMLTPYVNKHTEVFECPAYWSTRVKGDGPDGGPLYGNRWRIPDDLEPIGWSYGINANLKGLEKTVRKGGVGVECNWNSPEPVYGHDVKRPSTCTAFLDSNSDDNSSQVGAPAWLRERGYTVWQDMSVFLQDFTAWVAWHPGSAHSRANLGYNCVFADGHAENVTVFTHFDVWHFDDTYWTLDGN